MDKNDRIATIGSSILSQAEKESRALIEKANATRQKELAVAEDKIMAQTGLQLQKDSANMRHAYHASTAAARTEAREALLRKREELAVSVFDKAQEKLVVFSKTDGYPAFLLGEMQPIARAYDHTQSTVYLAEKDMPLAGEIQKLLPGAAVLPDENMRIGGWKLFNTAAGICIDQSFESRLLSQKEWFLATSGLVIT